jgi:hypothetical protein
VLRSLLDEAVQDPAGGRGLLYVGDVTQGIFGWRGGAPTLSREIFERDKGRGEPVIAERRPDESCWAGPAVLAMVNQVFGDAAAPGGIVPPEAAAACARGWRQHASARPEPGGWAELRHADDVAGRLAAPPAILRETDARAVWTSPRRCATSARRRWRISSGARVRWWRRRKAICTWRRTISLPVAWLALVRAAAMFDKRGRRAGAEILEVAERFTVPDAGAAGAVRVMTIPKAKGPGFSREILPDLDEKTRAARRDGLAVQYAPDRAVGWALEWPAKPVVERARCRRRSGRRRRRTRPMRGGVCVMGRSRVRSGRWR